MNILISYILIIAILYPHEKGMEIKKHQINFYLHSYFMNEIQVYIIYWCDYFEAYYESLDGLNEQIVL